MLTEEQEKALLEEIQKLRQDKAALISRVSSLEQSLYWLRKKVFGRMSEKSLPLGVCKSLITFISFSVKTIFLSPHINLMYLFSDLV